MMGGPDAVRKAAATAARKGGLANWRWSLKLTSLLLRLDPADVGARKTRATAARALGQRTDSANARGFYITEALQLEGRMMAEGRPVTVDEIRVFVGTPTAGQLAAASVEENLQFVRYLVDPRKAEGRRQAFTIAAEGDPRIRRLELRNGVLVITEAGAKGAAHVEVSRRELADFVLGRRSPRGRATRWPSSIALSIAATSCPRLPDLRPRSSPGTRPGPSRSCNTDAARGCAMGNAT